MPLPQAILSTSGVAGSVIKALAISGNSTCMMPLSHTCKSGCLTTISNGNDFGAFGEKPNYISAIDF
ncbi:MAG TPA: hypothetical protein PLG94_13770 [Smithellaceae bacterium]|nr:hypothetical protein [Smithellaceae bacterium]